MTLERLREWLREAIKERDEARGLLIDLWGEYLATDGHFSRETEEEWKARVQEWQREAAP